MKAAAKLTIKIPKAIKKNDTTKDTTKGDKEDKNQSACNPSDYRSANTKHRDDGVNCNGKDTTDTTEPSDNKPVTDQGKGSATEGDKEVKAVETPKQDAAVTTPEAKVATPEATAPAATTEATAELPHTGATSIMGLIGVVGATVYAAVRRFTK